MKKNLRKKKSSILKKIVVAIVALILVATGAYAYQQISGKKSLSIINSFIEQLDDSKEDAVGCCQFDCKAEQMDHDSCDAMNGEWNKGECVVGCCEIDVAVIETLPYKICSECTGGSWKEGQIYSSYLTMEDSGVIGGMPANWAMNMSVKACGENHVTANWTGAWEWTWVVEFPDGAFVDSSGETFSFTPDSGGRASFPIGETSFTVNVNKSNMHAMFTMPNLGNIILEGPIIKE